MEGRDIRNTRRGGFWRSVRETRDDGAMKNENVDSAEDVLRGILYVN